MRFKLSLLQMTKAFAQTKPGRRLNVLFQQWVIEQLLLNIEEYRDGVLVKVNGETKWLIPVFAMGLTDWPEGQGWAGMKQGATSSNRNCRCCTHLTEDFKVTKFGLYAEKRSFAQLVEAYRWV